MDLLHNSCHIIAHIMPAYIAAIHPLLKSYDELDLLHDSYHIR